MRKLPIAVLFPALLLPYGCGGEASEAQDPSLLKVELRDLQITVKENAELQAQRETVVRSEVEGQSTIIFLIEEGKIVQQGEKLVELDSSELSAPTKASRSQRPRPGWRKRRRRWRSCRRS